MNTTRLDIVPLGLSLGITFVISYVLCKVRRARLGYLPRRGLTPFSVNLNVNVVGDWAYTPVMPLVPPLGTVIPRAVFALVRQSRRGPIVDLGQSSAHTAS